MPTWPCHIKMALFEEIRWLEGFEMRENSKILVIDDEEYIRDIVSQFFGQYGCQAAAEDGQEGISLASRYPFDLIFSGPEHAQCNGYGGPAENPGG